MSRIVHAWWSQRILDTFCTNFDEKRERAAKRWVTDDAIEELRFGPSQITASIGTSTRRRRRVTLKIDKWTSQQRRQAVQLLAGDAQILASLLEWPLEASIEEQFESASLPLFPTDAANYRVSCTCPEWHGVCGHIMAMFHILAARVLRQPICLLGLHGVAPDKLLDDVWKARLRLCSEMRKRWKPVGLENRIDPFGDAETVKALDRFLENNQLRIAQRSAEDRGVWPSVGSTLNAPAFARALRVLDIDRRPQEEPPSSGDTR